MKQDKDQLLPNDETKMRFTAIFFFFFETEGAFRTVRFQIEVFQLLATYQATRKLH